MFLLVSWSFAFHTFCCAQARPMNKRDREPKHPKEIGWFVDQFTPFKTMTILWSLSVFGWPGQCDRFLNGCTSSQNWFWPEGPCSWIRAVQFSRSGWQKSRNLESCGRKKMLVHFRPFHLNWPEPVPQRVTS